MTWFLCWRKVPSLLLALSLSLLLAACGGGGGGGGGESLASSGPSGSSFAVSIDRTELKFSGAEGQALQPQVVIGSGSGTPPAVIYTGSLDLGSSLAQASAEIVGNQVRFTVYPKPNLSPGEHKGSLQLFACADAKCATHFTGSPATIPYTITITKAFRLPVLDFSLTALVGNTASTTIPVQLPEGQSTYEVRSSAPWLTVSDIAPGGFTATAQPLAPGSYVAIVSVTTGGMSRDAGVHYTVQGDGSTITSIMPSPSSFSFSAVATATPPGRLMEVVLPAWAKVVTAEVRYADSASGWLRVDKVDERHFLLTASAAALPEGAYRADVLLDAGPAVTPIYVPVTLSVGAASLAVSGTTTFNVDGNTTPAMLASDLTVDLPGLPPMAWTARSNAPWLTLLNDGGTTNGNGLHVAINVPEMFNYGNFSTHLAQVTVTPADSRIAPLKVVFSLTTALPELHYVSPHTRLPGEGGTFTLRGRGLDHVANLAQALQVTGATPTAVTRVSDTELSVQLPGAASGQVLFAVNNGVGAAIGAPVLQVVPQVTYGYQAVPTQGAKGGLVFDPERQAIYTANKTLQSVMRFLYNGSTWDAGSVSVPSVDAVAMSPDGKDLVVTATNGRLLLLDPLTLNGRGTFSTAAIGGDALNSLPRLAVTNDGKAFFQGSVWANGLPYFDLVNRDFGAVTTNMRLDFYSGPWFSVSGDGSRLNIVQSAGLSPAPGMLYMNSSDDVLKANPVGLTFWYEAAQSLHGERFVEDGSGNVWDRDFNLIGKLTLPDNAYIARAYVFSPDGSRVYVLAYNGNGAGTPRVYVFDSSTRMVLSTDLPVLGYFTIPDFPTCSNMNDYNCDTRAQGTISPDGKTLFFIGNANLVVAPITALTPASQPLSIQRASRSAATVPSRMVPATVSTRARAGH